ncbi:hypothetical protein ACJJTC_015172, partial [Scirpophaga incertulas]
VIELNKLTEVIYPMINIIICSSNGCPNKDSIKLLFKCILPKLIAVTVGNKSAHSVVRAFYVSYLGFLLGTFGKAALQSYIILLQHLCYTTDGLERAEVRSARSSLIGGLMSCLPHRSHRVVVNWLLELSTTSKVAYRHIALELIAKLLNTEADEDNSVSSEGIDQGQEDTGVADLDINIRRNNSPTAESLAFVNATRHESNQGSETPPNNNVRSAHCERGKHIVSHVKLLSVVYERLKDVSSTLRARALAILTDCVSSNRAPIIQAVKELNGDGEVTRIMSACALCVCDERAAVRRAAVTLLHRLLLAATASDAASGNVESVSSANLGILISLCRDASILVRSAAISAMGEVLLRLPCDSVFDAFFSGPVQQLSDPELKVQEQVVLLVQQVLIERLRGRCEAAEDVLPWRFLAAVVRHNMRRHLQKACMLMQQTGNFINHRIVDRVSTHLGEVDEERDLQCLVLLTSVARLVDYSDVNFVLQYFYVIMEKQTRDPRLVPLTLELLSLWCRFIIWEARGMLRDYLIDRLTVYRDDGIRVGGAILASALDPENLQWASEAKELGKSFKLFFKFKRVLKI